MITKEQALEFIDKLSELHVIHLDRPCGYMYIDDEKYDYRAWNDQHTLEALVIEVVRDNIDGALLMDFDKIPVDIDMLEVGQTYKVIYRDFMGVDTFFIERLLNITEDDNKKTFNFSNGYYITNMDEDIREIYKVNND